MAQMNFKIEDAEYTRIKQEALKFGLSAPALIRCILRDSSRKTKREEYAVNNVTKNIRALVPILAEALGHMQKESPEEIKNLSKSLLEKYDQEIK